MIIQCRVVQKNDDIGLSFPFRSIKPKAEEPISIGVDDAMINQTAIALRDSALHQDYIAKLAVPLSNAEDFLTAFLQYMVRFLTMMHLRIKNLWMLYHITFQSSKDYKKTEIHLEEVRQDALRESQKRIQEGRGTWFTDAIATEESMSPATLKGLLDIFQRNKGKSNEELAVDIGNIKEKKEDEQLDDVQKTMVNMDAFASPSKVKAQKATFEETKNTELNEQLSEILEHQKELEARLDEQNEKEEQEQQVAEQEAENEREKERKENSFLNTKLGGISVVFRKTNIFKGLNDMSFNFVANKMSNYASAKTIIGWMDKIPLDKMLNLGTFRHKMDEMLFHRIGLHQGSYLYNNANKLLGKIWHIIEPFISGFDKVMPKLTAMQKVGFEKYGTGIVKYGGGALNLYFLFYDYYVKLVGNFAFYFLSILIGIYLWYIVLVLMVIRWIVNLILARFGISI